MSLTETSRGLTDEMVNNGNAAVSDQCCVEISDTASLLHQGPTPGVAISSFDIENPPGVAISSFDIENPLNLSPEVPQNSSGVANVVLGVPSQHSQPPTPNAGCGIDNHALLTEAKEVANRVTFISTGGIFSELSGVIGNEKAALMHEYFFKAFMILCYVSLALGLALYRLIEISPTTRGFVTIVKLTIYFSQVSLVYAISFAICLIFPSKAGVVFILVAPLIPIGLVAILSFDRRDHESIS